MNGLEFLASRSPRLVVGLMSGTSMDGVDAVLVRLEGTGPGIEFDVLERTHRPYPESLRRFLLALVEGDAIRLEDVSQGHARLGFEYARVVEELVSMQSLDTQEVDLVGSHGQTVIHIPESRVCADQNVRSTLQLGDPSVLATELDLPVVGDFRPADMALGGQGAPLVPYFDYVCFTDASEDRILLNIGGIANVTALPAAADKQAVRAFDTGPGNMVLDGLARKLFDRPLDRDGQLAREGEVSGDLFSWMVSRDLFIQRPPPKSAGREQYGRPYVEALVERAEERHVSPRDILATATEFTVQSIVGAYKKFVASRTPVDRVIVSGGGTKNGYLMDRLRVVFSPISVSLSSELGVDADGKEALCFAVLAHEYVNGTPTGMPLVTGARQMARLGRLALPPAAEQ